MRTCRRCQRSLPKTDFHKEAARRDGLPQWCKECCLKYIHEYRKREKWNRQEREYRARYWSKDPKRAWAIVACNSARRRSEKGGFVCEITWKDLLPLCLDNCPVLGIPLAYERSVGRSIHAGSPTVDRLDNSKGYTATNIIVVSYRVNRIKNDASLSELETVLRFYQRVATH